MTTVRADYVESVMRDHGTQYWIIRDDAGKNILNRNEQDIGLEASIDKLRAALSNISGSVNVTIRSRKNTEIQTAGDKFTGVFEFKVKGNTPGSSYLGSPDISILSMMQENTKLQLEMQKRELESKYQGSNSESSLDKAIAGLLEDQTVKNVLAGLAAKFTGVTPAPVQIGASSTDQLSDMEAAAALFSAVDPDAPGILLKLAKHIKSSPGMWFGFKETLQQQKII